MSRALFIPGLLVLGQILSMKRRVFTILSAVSLVLCMATAGLLVWSLDNHIGREFVRHGVRWEIACRSGNISLDNGPQIWESQRPEREEAAIRQTFDREPWGSPRYREAQEQLSRMRKAREALPVGMPAPPAIARIEHAAPLEPFIVAFAILPALWWTTRGNRRPAGPIRRGLFAAGSAASPVLCAAAIGLWARSYYVADIYRCNSGRWSLTFDSSRGGLLVNWYLRQPLGPVVRQGYIREKPYQQRARTPWPGEVGVHRHGEFAGFWWYLTDGGVSQTLPSFIPAGSGPITYSAHRDVRVPDWFCALLFSLAPGIWMGRRRDRKPPGFCPACGYDLRATPDRCPECGAKSRQDSRAQIEQLRYNAGR